MPTRRTQKRARRAQRIIAVILLLTMALSGLTIYAASTVQAPTPQPTYMPTAGQSIR